MKDEIALWASVDNKPVAIRRAAVNAVYEVNERYCEIYLAGDPAPLAVYGPFTALVDWIRE